VNAWEIGTTAKSRKWYVVKYAGCAVTWASKMQTETASGTTEAESIAFCEGLRPVKHLMSLLE